MKWLLILLIPSISYAVTFETPYVDPDEIATSTGSCETRLDTLEGWQNDVNTSTDSTESRLYDLEYSTISYKEIHARDSNGLKLLEDGGNDGIYVNNDGIVTQNAQSCARAYLSADQENIANTTLVKVNINVENFDLNADFDTSNYRFVAPVNGYYQVNASIRYINIVADKTYYALIYVNGSAYSSAGGHTANNTDQIGVQVSDLVYAVAGQYIELYTYHNDGAGTSDIDGGSSLTFMSVTLIN